VFRYFLHSAVLPISTQAVTIEPTDTDSVYSTQTRSSHSSFSMSAARSRSRSRSGSDSDSAAAAMLDLSALDSDNNDLDTKEIQCNDRHGSTHLAYPEILFVWRYRTSKPRQTRITSTIAAANAAARKPDSNMTAAPSNSSETRRTHTPGSRRTTEYTDVVMKTQVIQSSMAVVMSNDHGRHRPAHANGMLNGDSQSDGSDPDATETPIMTTDSESDYDSEPNTGTAVAATPAEAEVEAEAEAAAVASTKLTSRVRHWISSWW
jgi:hypothetical protein